MIWKILGGAAVAIAAVVALPIAGGVGAITATAAVLAGTVGAGAGLAAGLVGEDGEDEARREGYAQGKAEKAAEVRDLQTKLKAAAQRFLDHKAYEEFLVAAVAAAVAAATADGPVTAEERAYIEQLVAGESHAAIPAPVVARIANLYAAPPNLTTAVEYVRRVDKSEWSIFDRIVNLVITRDGEPNLDEAAFRIAWRQALGGAHA